MVKALSFKGDSKPKKRKRPAAPDAAEPASQSTDLVTAATNEPEDETTWVSAEADGDISGPVILVLPTHPPTCLASDANGKIFASAVENMIEDEPGTAEPHDVRQVWIANRVAGTLGISFKGHHAKYLGVDKFGIPSATRDAISAEESFVCVSGADQGTTGTFVLRTTRDKYLVVANAVAAEAKAGPEIRGDAESVDEAAAVRIRMQARFKPRLKADKVEKAREKISRSQLEAEVGRKLEDDEVKKLKRARKEGSYYEAMLDVKVKGKHDKYA